MKENKLSLFVIIISLLYFPGILLPIMSFKAEIDRQGIINEGKRF